MPTVYLGVNKNFSSSLVIGQGSIDATSGSALGAILPCPGVFPCSIQIKSNVKGASTAVVENVYAGPNHLIIKETLHDYIPATANRIRVENKNINIKVAGGTYVQEYSTPDPFLTPYYNSFSYRSLSLKGLPSQLFLGNNTNGVVIEGSPTNASDPLNYAYRISSFQYNFSNSQLLEGCNILWTSNDSSPPLSINASGLDDQPLTRLLVATPSTDLRAFYIPVNINYPVIPSNFELIDSDNSTPTDVSTRSASNLLAVGNAPNFSCFETTSDKSLKSSIFGLQDSSNLIKSVSALFVPNTYATFCYLGIRNDNTAFAGVFASKDLVIDGSTTYFNYIYVDFFKIYNLLPGDIPKKIAAIKPSFAIDTRLISKHINPDFTNSFWRDAYPSGLRYSRYADIKSTQYGYVLLNKDTKHLEFMFSAYVDPWSECAEGQTVNKLIHAPPRSADFISASNMLLGINPKVPGASSLYKVDNPEIRNLFQQDQILHGGGGHVMALGTYNGAIVNGGKVTVWGSNRWGQLVLPEPMRTSGLVITDVAVSNAPPVINVWNASLGYGYFFHSIYSDEMAEKAARLIESSLNAPDIYKYAYPEGAHFRYGNHINYTNIPGHIVVVTQEGWVYAWGNNKYYQCEVPDEISYVDSSGAIKTGVPLDPIAEVAAGAYHTVARSKLGRIYVWGAGGPWVSTDGRNTSTGPNDVLPSSSGYTTVSQSVNFGQSLLRRSGETQWQGYAHLSNPSAIPPGTSGQTNEAFATTATIYTSVSTISKTINGSSVSIGQKTSEGFSVGETTIGSPTRMKGMIAAGAFHTAIIDSSLKIQCVGAGRGSTTQTPANPASNLDVDGSSVAQWGSSYTYELGFSNITKYATYPHYCQSLSQYRCPLTNSTNGVSLFRHSASTSTQHKSRYFQDLLFKKVVCGPFTTHGIIYSVQRIPSQTQPDLFTNLDKAYLHNRVVSWGCAFSPRWFQNYGTSSTGILGNRYNSIHYTSGSDYNNNPVNNPAGTLSGMGSVEYINEHVNRMFEIINRTTGTSGGCYTATSSLVGSPSSNPVAVANPSVGVVATDSNLRGRPVYNTDCPVTISRFKVKDMASCGDFAVYIGFLTGFTRSADKLYASSTSTEGAGATFDYHSCVFFTGEDIYRDRSSPVDGAAGRFHATNPYIGNIVARRNRVGNSNSPYLWPATSAMPMKTRSFHFGPIKRVATGVSGTLLGDSTPTDLEYVIPTTALASANLAVAIVNMDNRPTAWLGYYDSDDTNNPSPLDLSLLPSIPIQSFKTGKAHILAVSEGDWPVALGLGTADGTPKIVSELGSMLFEGTLPTQTIAPELIYGDTTRYSRPVLLAWGAGDGREAGTTFLAIGPSGDGGAGGNNLGSVFWGGSGSNSVFGLGFLDTHAVSRYDAIYATGSVQGLAVDTDAWENYYGHYRWNVDSRDDSLGYVRPTFSTNVPSGSALYNCMFGPPGHHAVEAMQSLLGFQQHLYPSTFNNPNLGARNLLNGTQKAAIPSAAFMPFITSASQTGIKARCCATAAEESTNFESLNSLLEYHSPLGYTQQTYTDYVVDYAAGAMHSAVLFRSSCASWTQINQNAHLLNMDAFSAHFMADVNGSIPFGQRRVCKLGIVGYGCEGQTAGSDRILQDGSVAPLVPRLFGTDAKVYCGDSYTLVTNPIRIVEASSGDVNLALSDSGAGFTSKTISISIPSSAYSKRIRGLDVKIQVITSSGSVNIPMSSWDITIPYKQNEWVVFKRLKANLDTAPADAFIQATTTASTFRVSNRFSNLSAYQYSGSLESYNEKGLDPTNSSSYTGTGPYFLKPINTAAAVPALDKSGTYYPVDVNPSNPFSVSAPEWSVVATSVVLPFNEPTINVVIKDYTSATSYANCFINITLEIEVDAEDVPYILYGPNKSGVWKEIPGLSPSFGADISSFSQYDDQFDANSSRWIRNCPCVIDNVLTDRQYPVGYPADTRFICGTKKYGPAGNRETAAAQVLTDYYNWYGGSYELLRPPLIKERVTANFFSVFTVIPHRPFLQIKDQVASLSPSLQVLPSAAFITTSTSTSIATTIIANFSSIVSIPTSLAPFRKGLTSGATANSCILQTNSAITYNLDYLQTLTVTSPCRADMSLNKNLNVHISLKSTDCGSTAEI
jgi:hypothetical protein